MSKVTRFVVLPDIHFPFADPVALKSALTFMEAFLRPGDIICQLGDLLDAYSLSSHEKGRRVDLQAEIDEAVEFLAYVRARHPRCRMAWIEGNHEERLTRYLRRQSKALEGVRGIGWREWLRLDDLDIEDYPYTGGAFAPVGDWVLRIEHGHKVNAAGPGRSYLQSRQCCGTTGHTHRLSKVWVTNMQTRLWWLEAGHLASLSVGAEYVKGVANWQQGIAAGHYSSADGVHAWGLPIVNGRVLTTESKL